MAEKPSGILVLNKPAGVSSAGALTRIKYLYRKSERPKFGHAGTLDPFATGVLLVLVGNATRRCEELMGLPKRYRATIKFGATTPTLDPTVEEAPDPRFLPSSIDLDRLRGEILPRFVGEILQAPPAFSALKQGGRRAYELARVGKAVELEPRPVKVYAIDVLSCRPPLLELDIQCGRGTYIRSLARDIASALGTTGYLTQLCRTAVGPYTLEGAAEMESLTRESLLSCLQK